MEQFMRKTCQDFEQAQQFRNNKSEGRLFALLTSPLGTDGSRVLPLFVNPDDVR